jgi:hypothetical protein
MAKVDIGVLEQLAHVLLAPERIERVCAEVVAYFADPTHNPSARKPELLKRRSELETGISRLVDAIAAGGECTPLVARIKALEQDRAAIDREVASIEASGQLMVTMDTMRKAMERLCATWKDALMDAPDHMALARQALQKLIDRPIELTRTERDGQPGVLVTVSGSLAKGAALAIDRDPTAVAQAVDSRGTTVGETTDVAQAVASPKRLRYFSNPFQITGAVVRRVA